MRFHIVTLFPKAFDSYLNESIISRAINGIEPRRQESGSRSKVSAKIKVFFYNPRDYTKDKHKRVDQKPYSGGPGMVIQAEPVLRAIEKVLGRISKYDVQSAKKNRTSNIEHRTSIKIIFLSPGGKQFDTNYAKNTAKKYTDIVIVCGRYEGIDARVKKVFKMEEVSVGNYVLTGGELPAMVIIDSVARQVEGVLGNFGSLEESRVSSRDVYTRPEVFEYLSRFDRNGRPTRKTDLGKGKKFRVPKVLLSGNHKKIEEWKKKKS